MLKSAKQKGTRLERNVAQRLRDTGLDKGAQRTPLSGAIPWMREDITTKLPIHFELKNRETWTPLAWWKETKGKCGNKMPILVLSRNGEDIYAFLHFEDLLTTLDYANKGGFTVIHKYAIPKKPKELALEETSQLKFSKLAQVHRKTKIDKRTIIRR
jgi:hypothetical protein